jgi:hypothetical protein
MQNITYPPGGMITFFPVGISVLGFLEKIDLRSGVVTTGGDIITVRSGGILDL